MEKERFGSGAYYVGAQERWRGERCHVTKLRGLRDNGEQAFAELEFPEAGGASWSGVLSLRDLVPVEEAGIKPLTLAVDFDETIVSTGGRFPAIEGLREGARHYINRLHEDGHYIIIWTCRHGDHQHQAEKYLYENGIRYHAINRHSPMNILTFGNDTRKIGADVYIDDKNILGIPSWRDIYRLVTCKAILGYREEVEKSIQNLYTASTRGWIPGYIAQRLVSLQTEGKNGKVEKVQ